MTFLNPILLFGTLSVAVPIVIHLLNRRQVQRVPWAAMRFLEQAVETNERRLQVEDLLLLLLRCLLLALLAFALARPTLNAAAGGMFGGSAGTTLIIVDDSYSMTQTTGVTSRFDVAKKAATQIVGSLSNGSSVAVWMADDGVEPIIAEPTRDMALVRKTIDDSKPVDRATDLLPAVRQGLEMLQRNSSSSKDLYLITDGQSTGFRQLAAIRQLLDQAKQQVKANVILIDQPETANLAVSNLAQSSGIAAIDRPLRFTASVTNYGSEAAHNVRVSLRLAAADAADRATQSSAAPVDDSTIDVIDPGQTKSVSLFARLKSDGYYAATASIPTDRVPADDSRTIVVRGVKQVKALLVDGAPGREKRDNATFFIKSLFDTAGDPNSQPLVDATRIDASGLQTANFDDYDLVVLADVADFAPLTADSLANFVKAGGGLVIFGGDHVRRDFYNTELANRDLLPATFGEPVGDAAAQDRITTFSDSALDHPIASLWKDPGSGTLSSVSIYKYLPLTPVAPKDAKLASATRPVLKLLDGTPAVVEKTLGDGRIIEVNVSPTTAWSDLPARPGVFVPLLYRVVGSIVDRRDAGLNITVGGRFSQHVPLDLLGKEAIIKSPDKDALPDSRRIELIGADATVTGPFTRRAGTYELDLPGQTPMLMAAQTDASESDLVALSAGDLEQLKQSVNVVECRIDTDLAGQIKQKRTGTELIFPLAILCLAIAVTESAMALWFSKSK